MKKKLRALGLGFGLVLGCAPAFAWMAMASGDGNGTAVYYGAETPQQAIDGAMALCARSRGGCEVGKAMNGTVMVIAKGQGGWGQASNLSPEKAEANALRSCREVARNCKVVQALWDPGVFWGALAFGTDASFIRVNADSREQAQSEALAGCRQRAADPQSCQIVPNFVQSARMHYAAASSGTARGFGISATADRAKALALESCKENGGGAGCKVEGVWLNTSDGPEPKGMARLSRLAERNAAAMQAAAARPSRTVSTTRSTNVLSCTNRCTNGACLRTFADGRQERWTAPRKYDPFTRNWGWDTTTNACGT